MTTNISKQKREELIKKINEIKAFIEKSNDDENKKNLLTYMGELREELITKYYGLVFEEHREKIDDLLKDNLPVLTEEKDLYINHGGQQNFLIEGDNLASLQLLEKTHRGKIDLIYIDPPYNTKNGEFIYDDCRVDMNDQFRHSKWCSFMEKRLNLAKSLLSKNGFIFISIDDYEQAALKILCDDVFGNENFINCFIWQRNSSGKTEKEKFTINTEYVLLYSRSQKYILNNVYKPLAEATRNLYKKDDDDGRGKYRLYPLQKPASPGPETTYDYIDNTGKIWKCPPKGWRMKYEKLKALENDGRLCFENKTLSEKAYWNERESEGKRIDTLWIDLPENTVGSSEVESLLGSGKFNNPKPTDLITRCIGICGNPSSTILDFFAGSGTTGHAVLKLNAEDGGNRKFILCTNNENSICRDITYERIKRVIQKENYDASLKYFRVDFIPITDKVYYDYADKLLEHTKELVELENAVNFTGNAELAIILSEEELDSFCADKAKINGCKKIYLGHNVASTAEQDSLFVKLQISVIRIPNYYYKED